MSNPWKLAVVILAFMLVPTCPKPLESTDEQLSEMEKDLASLSDDTKEDPGDDEIPESLLKDLQESKDDKQQTTPSKSDDDEDKIPESLLEDLLRQSDKSGHQTKPVDIGALQGFAPGTATDEDSKKTMEDKGVLLSEDDVNDKQKRLFEILSRDESEDNSKDSGLNSSDEEEEDKDKIPEDLLKDLEAKSREDQPRKPDSTWIEPTDENDATKKQILASILMDEIVNEIKEKHKRGERISDRVLDLLKKYNTK